MNQYSHLIGRIFLAAIFVLSGAGKVSDPAGTMGYMQAMGVPALLFWPTVAVELLGGLAVVVGFQTKLVSYLLAGFCLITALFFHRHFADQMQMIMFLKNVSMAGGFLLLASSGATALSIDSRKR